MSSQYYDLTLKGILKDVPKRFFKIITGFEEATFLDVQFPSVKYRQVDLLVERPDKTLLHIELQSYNDSDMDWRMLDYFIMISRSLKRIPEQLLLYVGEEKLLMGNGFGFESLQFKYRAMDIREINGRELLNSGDLRDVILSILCTMDDVDGTIKGILARSSQLPPEEIKSYILELSNLSRLRRLDEIVEKEVKDMPVVIDTSKDRLYLRGKQEGLLEGQRKGLLDGLVEGKREGLLEGLVEGQRKGLVEGQRKGLLEGIEGMLEIKYGPAGLKLMASVKKLRAVQKLERFKELIKTSKTIDELREFF